MSGIGQGVTTPTSLSYLEPRPAMAVRCSITARFHMLACAVRASDRGAGKLSQVRQRVNRAIPEDKRRVTCTYDVCMHAFITMHCPANTAFARVVASSGRHHALCDENNEPGRPRRDKRGKKSPRRKNYKSFQLPVTKR